VAAPGGGARAAALAWMRLCTLGAALGLGRVGRGDVSCCLLAFLLRAPPLPPHALPQIGDWGRMGNGDQRRAARMMADAAACMPPAFILSTGDNFYDREPGGGGRGEGGPPGMSTCLVWDKAGGPARQRPMQLAAAQDRRPGPPGNWGRRPNSRAPARHAPRPPPPAVPRPSPCAAPAPAPKTA
jgi:hypothetical protein